MIRGEQGEYRTVSKVGGEHCQAFLPAPLPPVPKLAFDSATEELKDKALLSLGRLDSLSTLLPDPSLFLFMFVRKEAVLSSQIEGTQSSLSELLLFEDEEYAGLPLDDVQEISNYVAGMAHGLTRIREGFPLCGRLLREVHGTLLAKGRGSEKQPGEYRRSQNWIGGTRPGNAVFVPPPPDAIGICMAGLERFLNDEPERTSPLTKAALAHVQFETIHPFLDGNGRLGRLLMTLILCGEGVLSEPMLYLSLYLKQRREQYYELLQRVRLTGDWEAWMAFFFEGVLETATLAVSTARGLVALFDKDRQRIQSLGRSAGSALRVHEVMQRRPICSTAMIARICELSVPSTGKAVRRLEELGVLRETTGRQRNRRYAYTEYIKRLDEGTEPL